MSRPWCTRGWPRQSRKAYLTLSRRRASTRASSSMGTSRAMRSLWTGRRRQRGGGNRHEHRRSPHHHQSGDEHMKRPRTVKEVLRTLARVEALEKLGRYEDVAAALAPHVNGVRIQVLGEFLDTVACYMKKLQTAEQYDPLPKCIECGADIDHDLT